MARSRHSRLRAAFADALQTQCVNLVGYYNVDVKAEKFSMIALNMDPMNEGKSLTLDELFPYNEKMAAAAAAADADQIRTWDQVNQKYNYYYMYYKKNKSTVDSKSYHWVQTIDGSAVIATEKLSTGSCVFYYAKNDNTLSVPGQVPAEAKGKLKHGFNMIGVGFPAQWNPNDAGVDFWNNENFAKGAAAADADQIRYWDEEKQSYRYFYLYYKKNKSTVDAKSYKWVETIDGTATVLEDPLKTGEGFFYYRQGEGEIEFKPGLKL